VQRIKIVSKKNVVGLSHKRIRRPKGVVSKMQEKGKEKGKKKGVTRRVN